MATKGENRKGAEKILHMCIAHSQIFMTVYLVIQIHVGGSFSEFGKQRSEIVL